MNDVMAALGRWLRIVGWLWFIAGFAASVADVADIGFFPGLILVFVGRMLRAQARRQESEQTPDQVSAEQQPRPLNTERTHTNPAPETAPQPVVRTPPVLPTPTPPPVFPDVDAEAEEKATRDKLFSTMGAAASSSGGDDPISRIDDAVKEGSEKETLTSAEMIARARERWDRRA